MFGTLSYDRDRQEPVFEADTTLPVSNRRGAPIHKACQLCRARKLRCSAEPSGCDRCKASATVCKYPPTRFRAGRRRALASHVSEGTSSHGSLATNSPTSNCGDFRGGGDFGQLEWQNDSHSTGIQEDNQHSLARNGNHGLDLENTFPAITRMLGNSAEHAFRDPFAGPWHDNQALRTSTTVDLGMLPELFLQPYTDFWGAITPLGASGSDPNPTLLNSSELPGAATPFGCEWSETTFGTSPELSSSALLSESTSDETAKSHKERSETKVYSDGDYCQCLGLVASLLEQVETQGVKSDTSLEDLLEACREPLRQCKALLACPCCKTRSECVLLLAMLTKSLSVVCNNLVQRYIKGRLEWCNEQLGRADQWPEVCVGTYFVEDSAEKLTVVGALIAAKLNDLHDVLTELKARARRREGHLAIILRVEKRVKDLRDLMSVSMNRRKSVGTANTDAAH